MKYIYTTKEVARMFKAKEGTIRDLYILVLKKNKHGPHFIYTREDIKQLEKIFK